MSWLKWLRLFFLRRVLLDEAEDRCPWVSSFLERKPAQMQMLQVFALATSCSELSLSLVSPAYLPQHSRWWLNAASGCRPHCAVAEFWEAADQMWGLQPWWALNHGPWQTCSAQCNIQLDYSSVRPGKRETQVHLIQLLPFFETAPSR